MSICRSLRNSFSYFYREGFWESCRSYCRSSASKPDFFLTRNLKKKLKRILYLSSYSVKCKLAWYLIFFFYFSYSDKFGYISTINTFLPEVPKLGYEKLLKFVKGPLTPLHCIVEVCRIELPKYYLLWVVAIASRLRAELSKPRIPAGVRSCPFFNDIETLSGAHPASCLIFTSFLSQGISTGARSWPLAFIWCQGLEWVELCLFSQYTLSLHGQGQIYLSC